MNFHILTLFPEMITQGLSTSIIGKAVEKKILSVQAKNIRDYTQNRHKKVDDYPYGGGAGMLMQAQPVYDAWKSVTEEIGYRPRTIYLTPQGNTFSQPMAKELAKENDLIFLCGHYEGIDERVLEEIVTDYVSIGDYVLTGGELPAMVMVDAIARMVPGVLANEDSRITESFEGNLLEYPQYSRPEVWMEKKVPEVLLSGNQKKINEWRREMAIGRTKKRRPDLYAHYEELEKCKQVLMKQKLLHIGMIELINRGQAKLLFAKDANICIYDMVSGIHFLTAATQEDGIKLLKELAKKDEPVGTIVLHQEFLLEAAQRMLGVRLFLSCYQAAYTRKEKLPITGLYRMDGKEVEGMPSIRRLTMEYYTKILEHYTTVDDPEYIKDRIEKGWMFGAFLEDEIAGFVGMHQEGSIGMLEVFPQYRGRKIGKALETYSINYMLEQGYIPYGQVVVGNEVSLALQKSLGLCFSKQQVFFLECQ